MPDEITISIMLEFIKLHYGISTQQLADHFGAPYHTMSSWEAGRRNPHHLWKAKIIEEYDKCK